MCRQDSNCPSLNKLGWTTRRDLVESWCGCCEPVGNRNGWNCISHKLAVTRFTASLQYQVSFCFSSALASSKCVCTSLILTISLLPFFLNSNNLVKSGLIIFHSMSSFTFLKTTNKPRIMTFPVFVMPVIALCFSQTCKYHPQLVSTHLFVNFNYQISSRQSMWDKSLAQIASFCF